MATIFQRYGGFAVISRIVLSFYDRVLDSDQLAPYFEHVDMPVLIDHQTKFIAYLTGGPATISDEALRIAHANRGIDRPAFEEMRRLLAETLEEHGLEPADLEAVMAEIDKRAGLVVTR
ncbi:MAG: group 1 truncated hemoglobin [Geminicoccaceae bacterium]